MFIYITICFFKLLINDSAFYQLNLPETIINIIIKYIYTFYIRVHFFSLHAFINMDAKGRLLYFIQFAYKCLSQCFKSVIIVHCVICRQKRQLLRFRQDGTVNKLFRVPSNFVQSEYSSVKTDLGADHLQTAHQYSASPIVENMMSIKSFVEI